MVEERWQDRFETLFNPDKLGINEHTHGIWILFSVWSEPSTDYPEGRPSCLPPSEFLEAFQGITEGRRAITDEDFIQKALIPAATNDVNIPIANHHKIDLSKVQWEHVLGWLKAHPCPEELGASVLPSHWEASPPSRRT